MLINARFVVSVPDPVLVKFCLMSVRGSVRYDNVGTLQYGVPVQDRYGMMRVVWGGTGRYDMFKNM